MRDGGEDVLRQMIVAKDEVSIGEAQGQCGSGQ